MGVSRPTVNSYLSEAREKGIVNISLDPARFASITIADELKRHFALIDCLVIPTAVGRTDSLIDQLGRAGALALRKFVRSGDTLAVGWGRTMLAVGEHVLKLPPFPACEDHRRKVAQMLAPNPASILNHKTGGGDPFDSASREPLRTIGRSS